MPLGNHDREELDDDELPDTGDDDTDTVTCPYCRQSVYEAAEQCPHCGMYLTEEEAGPRAKPWWLVAGTVACLAVVYLWIRYGL